jgi:hypothetical protein
MLKLAGKVSVESWAILGENWEAKVNRNSEIKGHF